jgi:hypothetical protein
MEGLDDLDQQPDDARRRVWTESRERTGAPMIQIGATSQPNIAPASTSRKTGPASPLRNNCPSAGFRRQIGGLSRAHSAAHPAPRESTCIVKDLPAIAGRSRIGTRFALSRVTTKSKRREGARQ